MLSVGTSPPRDGSAQPLVLPLPPRPCAPGAEAPLCSVMVEENDGSCDRRPCNCRPGAVRAKAAAVTRMILSVQKHQNIGSSFNVFIKITMGLRYTAVYCRCCLRAAVGEIPNACCVCCRRGRPGEPPWVAAGRGRRRGDLGTVLQQSPRCSHQ